MECETTTPIDDCYCDVWEAPHLLTPELLQSSPSSSTSDHHFFYIRIDLEFLSPPPNAIDEDEDEDDDDEDFDPDCFESITKTEHFWAPCRRLNPDEKIPRGFVSGMLSGMGIPADGQPFLVQKISECADEIANAAHNEKEKILGMIVSASVLVDSLEDHRQQTNA